LEAVLVAITGAVLVYSILYYRLGRSSKIVVKQRIEKLTSVDDMEKVHDEVLKEKEKKQSNQKKRGFITTSKKLENYLVQSGIKLKTAEFLYTWIGATLLPILLLFVLNCSVITIVGGGVIGFAIPPIIVKKAKSQREQLFNKQLGESLIVIGNCIRSGYSFQQAMESVSKDMQPPISVEFTKTLREIQFGVKQEEALNHMVERVQNKDLDLLVSAIITATQVGGNLSEILDTIAATIKDRIKIRDEVRVLTASGRISGIIIGLLPVIITLFLMMVNPEYIQSFFENSLGKIIILVGVVLEVIGFSIVNKIVDIKY